MPEKTKAGQLKNSKTFYSDYHSVGERLECKFGSTPLKQKAGGWPEGMGVLGKGEKGEKLRQM